jgi:hypothetical protein
MLRKNKIGRKSSEKTLRQIQGENAEEKWDREKTLQQIQEENPKEKQDKEKTYGKSEGKTLRKTK